MGKGQVLAFCGSQIPRRRRNKAPMPESSTAIMMVQVRSGIRPKNLRSVVVSMRKSIARGPA